MSAVCFAAAALSGASLSGTGVGAGTTDANPSRGTTSVSTGGRFEAFALLGMLLNSSDGRPSAIATDATSAAATPTRRGVQAADRGRAAPNFFLASAISGMKGGGSEAGGSEAGAAKTGAGGGGGAGVLTGAAKT